MRVNLDLRQLTEIKLMSSFLDLSVAIAKYLQLEKNGVISIVIHRDSNAADILQAFIHALVMAKLIREGKVAVHLESQLWMDKHYKDFVLKLQSWGWRTERLLSPSVVWRANWLPAGSSNSKAD